LGSFGDRLRREREMRKISLEEIAAATKIGTRHLRALEEEEFNKLPGGIFNKGFVRAYARFLGINEDQAVSDYLVAAGEPENQTSEIVVDQIVAQHEAEKKAKVRFRELETINRNDSGIPWGAIVALIVIVAAVAGGWTYYSRYKARLEARPQQAQTQPGSPASSAPAAAQLQAGAATADTQASAPQESATQSSNVPASAAAASSAAATNTVASAQSAASTPPSTQTPAEHESQPVPGEFIVSIRATKPAWISVTADGKHVMSSTMSPADAKSIHARNSISLTTGNAGGVEISFNGKPIPPLGGDGEVRKATFTPEGIKQQ
jgi:cytoskeleton protein RodZ